MKFKEAPTHPWKATIAMVLTYVLTGGFYVAWLMASDGTWGARPGTILGHAYGLALLFVNHLMLLYLVWRG